MERGTGGDRRCLPKPGHQVCAGGPQRRLSGEVLGVVVWFWFFVFFSFFHLSPLPTSGFPRFFRKESKAPSGHGNAKEVLIGVGESEEFPLSHTDTQPFPSLFILKRVINPGPPRWLEVGDSPRDGPGGGWRGTQGSPGRTREHPNIGSAGSFLLIKDNLLPNQLI